MPGRRGPGAADATGGLDFRFHLEPVRCLGCCSLAPVLRVDGRTFGHTNPRDVARLLAAAVPEPTSCGAGEGT
ncbi:MAG: NAD(P)H-dependent oxidoreductase subunit E [Bacillota bacterium]|nr:NAD(P)H-dependent oxidoreductase subunit E [Bacillota bacterium]